MPITATSTIAQVEAQLLDNSGYDAGDGSVASAKLFAAACRALLGKRPADLGHGSGRLAYSRSEMLSMLTRAEQWIASQGSASDGSGTVGASYFDVSGAR